MRRAGGGQTGSTLPIGLVLVAKKPAFVLFPRQHPTSTSFWRRRHRLCTFRPSPVAPQLSPSTHRAAFQVSATLPGSQTRPPSKRESVTFRFSSSGSGPHRASLHSSSAVRSRCAVLPGSFQPRNFPLFPTGTGRFPFLWTAPNPFSHPRSTTMVARGLLVAALVAAFALTVSAGCGTFAMGRLPGCWTAVSLAKRVVVRELNLFQRGGF